MSLYRERVTKTLRGEWPDRVARGEFFIADEFIRPFLGLDAAAVVEFQHRRSVVEELDLDIATVPFSAGWGAPEQPDADAALDTLMQWSAAGDRYLFALIDGPFSAGARAGGFDALMRYVRGAPWAAHDLFARGTDEALMIAQAARDAGSDGVILGEDIAYGRTTYASPVDLRDLYFPELARAVAGIRALGLSVFFHSDGNLAPVLGDLASCGLDGIQGLEPEAGMSVEGTRAAVGPGLTLWGNLGFEVLSTVLSDDEIRAFLPHESGGPPAFPSHYIFGSCPGLVQGMNLETVRRLYRVLIDI